MRFVGQMVIELLLLLLKGIDLLLNRPDFLFNLLNLFHQLLLFVFFLLSHRWLLLLHLSLWNTLGSLLKRHNSEIGNWLWSHEVLGLWWLCIDNLWLNLRNLNWNQILTHDLLWLNHLVETTISLLWQHRWCQCNTIGLQSLHHSLANRSGRRSFWHFF